MIVAIKRFSLLVLPAFLLSACGEHDVSEVQDWMETVKRDSHIVIVKPSAPKVYMPVPYNGKNDIDPFNPSKLLVVLARLKAESSSGIHPDMDRRREALEAFPLDTLKMVGIIEKNNLRQALIQVDKTVYQAKVGNYIGANFGLITKIADNEIEIKEIVQDASGEWTERNTKLELQESKK
ncbi:pilus assembly protein PilP [Undibacterium sp. SXout7W]|uniref:pilus assembly protein PilP n=1 Tax=Undibacterium sp. SXout7W TaxID=3413049 RepID=UPI003BF0E323